MIYDDDHDGDHDDISITMMFFETPCIDNHDDDICRWSSFTEDNDHDHDLSIRLINSSGGQLWPGAVQVEEDAGKQWDLFLIFLN